MPQKNEFGQVIGEGVVDWHARRRPDFAKLLGNHCSVFPLDPAHHGVDLFKNLTRDNQGESWTYFSYGPFFNYEQFGLWLKKMQAEADTMLYAILNIQNEPVGMGGFLRINPEHGVIEVGHLHYSVLLKQTIAATESMYLMMRYAFETLGYRRYEWKCNSLNQASVKAALRLGFTFEGTFRQNYVFKGRNRDTSWFSIIDSEWPALKRKFVCWLDPSNFDSSGQQIRSLRYC